MHIGYWLLYLLLIITNALSVNSRSGNHLSMLFIIRFLLSPTYLFAAFLPAAFSFYTFYGFLFHRFLQRKKFIMLSISALLVPAISGLLAATFIAFETVFKENFTWGSFVAIISFISFVSLIHGIIGLVMKGFINWYGDIRIKEQLIRKNYETELALVKSQLNPHFLFNTINNIDVLIEKDAVRASSYLNKLSDIMRFMLYETKTESIPLTKELTYIGKYIELQKIRTANPHYINFEVEGDPDEWMIEPMLFIPFLENAFKHAENKKVENAINIRFLITEEKIMFECENSFSGNARTEDAGGLGNDLIRKRLSLLYPDRYILETTTTGKIYKAKLTVAQHADKLHHS